MENHTSKKWHEKTTYIIICLILFFPVGLYFMWKNNIWSKKARWIISIFFLLAVIFNSQDVENNEISSDVLINNCLTGYDWCLPSCDNPTYAWKFNINGTFNYSTTLFGGMSAWGNWEDIGNQQIKIVYTKTSTGDILPENVISMPSCSSLKIHSSVYYR